MARQFSRRDFIKIGALAGAGLFVPWKLLHDAKPVSAFSNSTNLTKFVQPLRMAGDIPIASPDPASMNPGWWQRGVAHYTIDIGQYVDQIHPLHANGTRLWGFGQGYSASSDHWTKHLGGIIIAKRGEPVQITFRNHLPDNHILPIDASIMGAMDGVSRADIHLHGGYVPWISDGTPYAWWDPKGNRGNSFINNHVLRPRGDALAHEAEYYYPNDQSARLMWYHDHTFGNTRINAYAGIATAYVLTDDYEAMLSSKYGLPAPASTDTIYLVFQDKVFIQDSIATTDPTWGDSVQNTRTGDLWYDHTYAAADRDPNYKGTAPLPTPSEVPEFFGDTMLVNGLAYPYLEVEARQYRFRMLNACNARFLNPRLVIAMNAPNDTEVELDAITKKPKTPGPGFMQIGTEGGFLPHPVMVNVPNQPQLLLAPAERADLIVDFRGLAGSKLILYNDAPAPYPMGDSGTDYYSGNPENPASGPSGVGPNTRTIMQFIVKPASGTVPVVNMPSTLTPTDPFLVDQIDGQPTPIPSGVPVRRLTLNETYDDLGRLIQFLGTDQIVKNDPVDPFGMMYHEAPTEVIHAGSTEVWEIANMTGDTHPIHFHLVNVQILSRQEFDVNAFLTSGGTPILTGLPKAPDANEMGWKETVRMAPGEVTRVLMRFSLPAVPFTVPVSPRTGGHEYVWHCHILEHEEHDMMRPLIVQGEAPFVGKYFMPRIDKFGG